MKLRKLQAATNPELYRKFVKVSGVDPDDGVEFIFVGRVTEITADTFTVTGFLNDQTVAKSEMYWIDSFQEKDDGYKIHMIGPFAEIEF